MRVIPTALQGQLTDRGFEIRCFRWRRWGFWPQAQVEIYAPHGELVFSLAASQGQIYQVLSILRLGVEIGSRPERLRVRATGRWNHKLTRGGSDGK